MQRGVSGCCDCGDPTAWDPKGFCKSHSGYQEFTEEKLREILPDKIKKRISQCVKGLCEHLHTL